MKWNREKFKMEEMIIFVIFQYEWNSLYFICENGYWGIEMCAGENIWNRRNVVERYVTGIKF